MVYASYFTVSKILFFHFCLLAKLTFTGLFLLVIENVCKISNLFPVQYEDVCEYSLISACSDLFIYTLFLEIFDCDL